MESRAGALRAAGKSRRGNRELSLLAEEGDEFCSDEFCSDEFSVRWNTSCPWQQGRSQRGRAGAGTCWAGSTHRSRVSHAGQRWLWQLKGW